MTEILSEISGVVSRMVFAASIIVLLGYLGLTLAPANFNEIDSNADPITECSDINNEPSYYNVDESTMSESSIQVSTTSTSVILNVPEGISGSLEFRIDPSNVNVLRSEGLINIGSGEYRFDGGSKGTLEYQLTEQYRISGIPGIGLGIVDGQGYTVLPHTARSYIIESGDVINDGPISYLGETVNTSTSNVGCQEITQVYPNSTNIDGDIETIKHISGSVPFDNNYSELMVYYTSSEIDSNENYNGVASENSFIIYDEADRNPTLIHEYIHTRQDISNWSGDYSRPWYIEGSAEYYTDKIMYELGMSSYQEYKAKMIVSRQRIGNESSELYQSEDPKIGHYDYGASIFYNYSQQTTDDYGFHKLPSGEDSDFKQYYSDKASTNIDLCTSSKCKVTVRPALALYHPTNENIIWLVSAAIPIYILLELVYRIRRYLID